MHIKTPQAALLSNHELLLHLQAEEAEYARCNDTGSDNIITNKINSKRPIPSGLAHMLRDGITYLQNAHTAAHPNRPMTLYKGPHSLFRALAPKYRLNKAEYLQLYNLRPTTQVWLEPIIEEAGTRFTDNELADILKIIQAVFEEEEAGIPAGVEEQDMEKIPDKLLGANRRRRKGRRNGKV